MSAYDDLRAHLRQTAALGEVAGRLGWTSKPSCHAVRMKQRAEEMAAIEDLLHARRTDPRLGALLDAADAPDEAGAAILREAQRDYTAQHSRSRASGVGIGPRDRAGTNRMGRRARRR